ncbi:hypothetical protein QS257_10545 [Terrilactibacillus sp. S3-3]|nr:hypothetical protein QS257_10545 [Terrilactibacillus sp. S3-3]
MRDDHGVQTFFFLLYLIDRFNGERSLSGIYHLLRGKRSSQTVQDSFLFHVEPFFHLLDELKRAGIDRLLSECRTRRWLTSPDNIHFRLSADGKAALLELGKACHFPKGIAFVTYVNGEKLFWLRLQLLVQTLSELIHRQSVFLPMTNQINVTEFKKNIASPCRRRSLSIIQSDFQRYLSLLVVIHGY